MKKSTEKNVNAVKKSLGKKGQPISAIAEKTGLSIESARTALAHLRDAGIARMDGIKRTAVYALA
jgi:ribosomal protein S25